MHHSLWQVLYRAAMHNFSLLVAGAITLCLLTFYGVPLDPNSGTLLAGGPPYTPHPTFYTLHPTLCTLNSALHILHPTPYTLHPALYTPQPSPYTLHPTRESQPPDPRPLPLSPNPKPKILHP
jgi:hypothetical protein